MKANKNMDKLMILLGSVIYLLALQTFCRPHMLLLANFFILGGLGINQGKTRTVKALSNTKALIRNPILLGLGCIFVGFQPFIAMGVLLQLYGFLKEASYAAAKRYKSILKGFLQFHAIIEDFKKQLTSRA
ncbi:hypothetical protein FGO68_gene6139 [Halteria grandinella]|uniref:Uncharacterized protein n=1 Tax=Halteria grandinella TaxID=5974 RepID=A0A8J8NSF7_HALGN|nr:hypothetical protein FGO68_gene6139 [Halteria grandinella]